MTFSRRGKDAVALLVGVACALAVFEIVGRSALLKTGFQTSMMYTRFHPQLGFEIDPAIGSFRFEQPCLQITQVTVDSEGHRANGMATADSASDDALRIAVLGDSFMMGREVADNETTAAQLARAIDNSTVINFGVPGYGSIQAYLSYVLKASKFKPDVTVLGFLDVNDVAESSRYIIRDDQLADYRPYFADDGETILPPRGQPAQDSQGRWGPRQIHQLLKNYSFTYYSLISYVVKPLQQFVQTVFSDKEARSAIATNAADNVAQATGPLGNNSDMPYWWQRQDIFKYLAIYQRNPDEQYEAAWRAAEKALLLLKETVDSNQGHFILMLIPSENASWMAAALKRYEQEFGEPAPPGFDLRYPAERLIEFGKKHNIDVLDLTANFAAYRDKHNLQEPYFHFRCDGHWSPLGHYIAAQSIAEHLEKGGIIDARQRRKVDFLERSPEEILGADAMKKIFGWGEIYRGRSDISNN